MVSITTWTRLEPRCRDASLQNGLEARLHDPLWMLARQWQLGEFAAHDGGSAAQVRLSIACAPLSRYRPTAEGADAHPYDPGAQPLEAVVEREQPDETGHRPDLRAAAEAGLHFVRLLRRHDAAGYAEAFRDRYPLPGSDGGGAQPPGDDAARFLAVMGGRAIDGARLHRDLADLPRADDGALERLPDEPPVTDDDRDAVAAAAGHWLAWYEDTHGVGAQPPSSWSTQRMTHGFAVSAVTGRGEVALAASEHPGGRLDWDAFDHAPQVALRDGDPHPDEEPRETATTVLPGRVRYRGMPTSRWWEMEDAGTDLGRVATGPEDLARLLFVDLAITYGNDWFLAPVDVDIGSLCEVRSLVVTDTFGQRTLVRHHVDVDGADGRWRMFGLSAPAGHPAGRMMLLPPTLPAGQHGPAVEEVLLRRDEVANLAWAVERTAPSALGTPLDRRGDASGRSGENEETPEREAPFVYRPATDVPDHWFPLVPVRGPEPGQRRLVRGRMPAAEGEALAEPWGALLRAVTPLVLLDEVVPRAGVRLTRRDERARWSDGSTHQWRARRRQVGGGEAWSGLRYDAVEAAEPSEGRE